MLVLARQLSWNRKCWLGRPVRELGPQGLDGIAAHRLSQRSGECSSPYGELETTRRITTAPSAPAGLARAKRESATGVTRDA